MDGIVIYSARTAANVDPYWLPVANGTNGTVEWAPDPAAISGTSWDADILSETLGQFFLNGVDAQLHVDGDLAVHVSLNAAEAYRKAYPKACPIRLALAHASLTLEEDWPRFAELGVDAVFSFQWSQSVLAQIHSRAWASTEWTILTRMPVLRRLDALQSMGATGL